MTWWNCPSTPPCPHAGALHDIEDLEDVAPRCCVEGCLCGVIPQGEQTGGDDG